MQTNRRKLNQNTVFSLFEFEILVRRLQRNLPDILVAEQYLNSSYRYDFFAKRNVADAHSPAAACVDLIQ